MVPGESPHQQNLYISKSARRPDWEQSTFSRNDDLHLRGVSSRALSPAGRLKLNHQVVMVQRQSPLVIRPTRSLGNDNLGRKLGSCPGCFHRWWSWRIIVLIRISP